MNKAFEQLGHAFHRATSDLNGNPRYIIHFLAFSSDYDKARKLANSIGFRVYRGRDFGGGFVGQSYDLEGTAKQILTLQGAA